MSLHYEILDEQRKALLPLFKPIRELGFYLAGGTALALQLGHRDSIDFDFFIEDSFDTEGPFKKLTEVFRGYTLVRVQEEKDTLVLVINDEIRVSFMTYAYPLITPMFETEFFSLASLVDIGCMKLSAITSRSVFKDYVDLYFILHEVTLAELIKKLQLKMPTLDPLLALKSLVYFDDIILEELLFKVEPVPFETIKIELIKIVKEYKYT